MRKYYKVKWAPYTVTIVYHRNIMRVCLSVSHLGGWGGERGGEREGRGCQWRALARLGRKWAALSRSDPSPPPPLHAVITFSSKSPPHQNTPNGKKIRQQGGGGRQTQFTVFYRPRASREHGLKDKRRVWRETTEHKADGRKRLDSRLAFQQSESSACYCSYRRVGHKVEAARLLSAQRRVHHSLSRAPHSQIKEGLLVILISLISAIISHWIKDKKMR